MTDERPMAEDLRVTEDRRVTEDGRVIDATPRPMSCQEAADFAELYVLHALSPDEHGRVEAHLAECSQPHPEFAELGGAAQALAFLVEPLDAPAELKDRVMAAVAAEPSPAAVAAVTATVGVRPSTSPSPEPSRPAWRSVSVWAFATAAVLVIAVLGTWSMVLQSRANVAEDRVASIALAIAANADPNAAVATLHGTGAAAAASGFAAFPQDGDGYIVLVGLPPAPAGRTYQAWFLIEGQSRSAGLMIVGDDGYAVLSGVRHLPGTESVALTVETAGGAAAPTGEPVVAGDIS